VMPLLVEPEAVEEIYFRLRQAGCAVFRWDRVWPGVPAFEADHGARWQRGLLHLLTHQDLDEAALQRTAGLLHATV